MYLPVSTRVFSIFRGNAGRVPAQGEVPECSPLSCQEILNGSWNAHYLWHKMIELWSHLHTDVSCFSVWLELDFLPNLAIAVIALCVCACIAQISPWLFVFCLPQIQDTTIMTGTSITTSIDLYVLTLNVLLKWWDWLRRTPSNSTLSL